MCRVGRSSCVRALLVTSSAHLSRCHQLGLVGVGIDRSYRAATGRWDRDGSGAGLIGVDSGGQLEFIYVLRLVRTCHNRFDIDSRGLRCLPIWLGLAINIFCIELY